MKWTSIEEPHDCSKITKINISSKRLTEIPDWISKCNNLIELYCSYNQIKHIPNTLPNSLQIFECAYNQITQIPDTLPVSLREFYCSFNEITQIPDTLPNYLQEFLCSYNQITQIPDTLPNSLQKFLCFSSQITHIPLSIVQLQNLKDIWCDDNIWYTDNIYKPSLVKYFLCNLDNNYIKKQCYDLIWKVRMEF